MRYPIGVQNFEKLRLANMAYVDKTALVYELATTGTYCFLGRPRRFGKSLLLSTLEAYFEGKRELFKGLAIEQLETEWKRYPVLHLDLNAAQYSNPEHLLNILNTFLTDWEKQFGCEPQENMPSTRFAGIIRRAYEQTGSQVVILVDEYDKPLAMNVDNEELQDEFRGILKAFYSVMKSSDRYIKFGFLTGVTKFSKVSVFSDLNNIDDISMWDKYITICGMSEQEIRDNFDEGMQLLADKNQLSKDECYAELRRRYDGYHFCEGTIGMYNPYSVINTLNKQKFGDYWFESGTPTRLIKVLKKMDYNLNQFSEGEILASQLTSVDSVKANPLSIFYQSGFLTIKNFDKRFGMYKLGFPNQEVETGFTECLVPLYTNIERNRQQFDAYNFVRELEQGQPEAFLTRLSAMMADTDNRIVGKAELYLENFLFVFFRMLGLYVEVERATSYGRMDMVVKTQDFIYVIEFKRDQTAEAALQQIDEKGYAAPFAADPRRLFKLGINFSTEKRCVNDWKIA